MGHTNRCRIVFSFDDARADSYEAIKIAAKYGIKSTLNVTTGYVDGTLPETCKDFPVPAMSKEQVIELSENPLVEIACHSHFHRNDLEDILKGRDELSKWLRPGYKLGFVSPGSSVDFNVNPLKVFKQHDFLFVRIGPRWGRYEKLLRVIRKMSRVLKSNSLFWFGYKGTIINAIDDNYLIHGIPVIHDNTLEQFKYIISKSLGCANDIVFIWHSVLDINEPAGLDNWSWNKTSYVELCQYISDNLGENLQTCFTRDLIE